MPSFDHEVLLQLFRNRPLLAPELLQQALHQTLPAFNEARVESADLTNIQPAEYRADLVVLLLESEPVLGIIVEVQLSRDPDKAYSWPVYIASLRARLKVPVRLLVVAPDEGVARWASNVLDFSGGNPFKPWVMSAQSVPVITDIEVAKADPELAVFSVLAHGRDENNVEQSLQIVEAAIAASIGLDESRSLLYVDLIVNAVPEALSRALKAMNLSNYEFKSEFARRYIDQGIEKGRAQGIAQGREEGRAEGELQGERKGRIELLTKMLTVKFGNLPAEARAHLQNASPAELDGMAERMLTAVTLVEVLQ